MIPQFDPYDMLIEHEQSIDDLRRSHRVVYEIIRGQEQKIRELEQIIIALSLEQTLKNSP